MEFRKIEIREYALSWAMGLSETKASYPSPRFALSIFPDFVIFLVPWSGAEATHLRTDTDLFPIAVLYRCDIIHFLEHPVKVFYILISD